MVRRGSPYIIPAMLPVMKYLSPNSSNGRVKSRTRSVSGIPEGFVESLFYLSVIQGGMFHTDRGFFDAPRCKIEMLRCPQLTCGAEPAKGRAPRVSG